MTLALAAPELHKPSETFIRDHILKIAPKQTVLLVQRKEHDSFGLPALTGIGQPFIPSHPLAARAVNALRVRLFPRKGPQIRLSISDTRQVANFLKAHGVTTILAEYLVQAAPLIEAAHRAGAALYAHAHGFDATRIPQESQLWRERYGDLFQAAAGVFAPSEFIAARLEKLGCPRSKLTVIPCGVDPGRFSPTRAESNRVLAVGRLVPKKAPHLTIAAFCKATRDLPDARLDMVGDGELMEICRDEIARQGAEHKVHLLGWQSSDIVRDLMTRASIFAQHSITAPSGDTEGLPVAILEAMASALPVISTRHSGIPEAVVEGETGILVAEHDVDAMANAFAALLTAPLRARAMGNAGRKRVLEHFTIDRTIARLQESLGLRSMRDDLRAVR